MAVNFGPKPTLVDTSISLYEDEFDQLQAIVERLKARNAKFATRTRLIRLALEQFLSTTPIEQIEAQLAELPTQRR